MVEHKQYFQYIDEITEFVLEGDIPIVTLTDDFTIEKIKEMEKLLGMSVKDMEEDNKFYTLKEITMVREKNIKSTKNHYHKWYRDECKKKILNRQIIKKFK